MDWRHPRRVGLGIRKQLDDPLSPNAWHHACLLSAQSESALCGYESEVDKTQMHGDASEFASPTTAFNPVGHSRRHVMNIRLSESATPELTRIQSRDPFLGSPLPGRAQDCGFSILTHLKLETLSKKTLITFSTSAEKKDNFHTLHARMTSPRLHAPMFVP